MAGLVPAIHAFLLWIALQARRGCPARGRAWRWMELYGRNSERQRSVLRRLSL